MPHIPDVNPDGLRVIIPWGDIMVGESLFVPCIKLDVARMQLILAAKSAGMSVRVRTRVEHGILGLRVWRIA